MPTANDKQRAQFQYHTMRQKKGEFGARIDKPNWQRKQ